MDHLDATVFTLYGVIGIEMFTYQAYKSNRMLISLYTLIEQSS